MFPQTPLRLKINIVLALMMQRLRCQSTCFVEVYVMRHNGFLILYPRCNGMLLSTLTCQQIRVIEL